MPSKTDARGVTAVLAVVNPNKRIVIVMHSTLCLMVGVQKGEPSSDSARRVKNAANFSCQSTRFSGQPNRLAQSVRLWRVEYTERRDNLRTTDCAVLTVLPT